MHFLVVAQLVSFAEVPCLKRQFLIRQQTHAHNAILKWTSGNVAKLGQTRISVAQSSPVSSQELGVVCTSCPALLVVDLKQFNSDAFCTLMSELVLWIL